MICGICQFGNFELEALIKHVEDVHECPGFRSVEFGRHIPCGIEFHREISQRGDHMPRSSYCHPATYNVSKTMEQYIKCEKCPDLRIRTYKSYFDHHVQHFEEECAQMVNELPTQMDTQHDADDEDEGGFETQDDYLLRYIPTQALSNQEPDVLAEETDEEGETSGDVNSITIVPETQVSQGNYLLYA
ncbi:unnamed protein product [Orchesella dallaii]|uniref:C2H2-type domain-containing protein n=1 Tax=Orchesella dallaii TaxID=48710 RepID=A0ABP1PYF3_9HEXA